MCLFAPKKQLVQISAKTNNFSQIYKKKSPPYSQFKIGGWNRWGKFPLLFLQSPGGGIFRFTTKNNQKDIEIRTHNDKLKQRILKKD